MFAGVPPALRGVATGAGSGQLRQGGKTREGRGARLPLAQLPQESRRRPFASPGWCNGSAGLFAGTRRLAGGEIALPEGFRSRLSAVLALVAGGEHWLGRGTQACRAALLARLGRSLHQPKTVRKVKGVKLPYPVHSLLASSQTPALLSCSPDHKPFLRLPAVQVRLVPVLNISHV